MDFHFPYRLYVNIVWIQRAKKGILEIIINLLPMKYEFLDKIQMVFIHLLFYSNHLVVIHFHTQFMTQFLKMLKCLLSSSIWGKNSWSKICDFMARDVSAVLVFIFAAPFRRFLSKLMNLTWGRHAVMFADNSKLQRKFPSKFSRSTRKRFFGHSRFKVERRLKARLRFFTQLMSFQLTSLIWLLDKTNVL